MSENVVAETGTQDVASPQTGRKLACGLIMPISAIDGCTAEHWGDVKEIVTEAVESLDGPSFEVQLVSDADDVGVIQKRIVQNVYNSDIVVCDVSGKNPNVMFELGMRLAFDKPTVIIKDDKTDYSFDTGIIEHVPYPRDLRFNKMVIFKSVLASKVAATYKAAQDDPEHSTFLKNFGQFHIASLSEATVSADTLVVEMLSDLQTEMSRMRRMLPRATESPRQREARARIYAAVARFFADNPGIPGSELLQDEGWCHYMESECEGSRYYRDFEVFKRDLERVVGDLGQA